MRRLALAILPVALLSFASCGDDDGDDGGGTDAAAADAAQESDASAEADAAVADAAPEADAMPEDDAMPSNLACVGEALPSTAAATLTIAGTTSSIGIGGQAALDTVDLEARLIADDSVLSTTTSDAAGAYSITAANPSELPLAAYLVGTKATYVPTHVYPPTPVSADQDNVPVLMIAADAYQALGVVYADPDQSADNGVVSVVVLDCDGNPVDGATVTATTSTQVVYGGPDGLPDLDATSTSTAGIAFIFNVPPGDVDVDAEVGGVSLREHTVTAAASTVVTTAIVP